MARVAVVTGANRGLGLGTARQLAIDGYTVVLTARTQAKANDAAGELAGEGLTVVPYELDVANELSCTTLFDWLDDEFGRIDVLVNNAGTIFEREYANRWDVGPFEIPTDLVAEAFNTNTLGAYRTMLRAIPRMNAAGYGRIVNVTTGMGGIAEMGGGYPAYRISKAALNAATRVFAHEAGFNVKINAVCPGWVKTAMGGSHANRDIASGVSGIVWAATLPDDGPNNGFFRDGKPVPW